MISLDRYRVLFSTPGIARLFLASVLGRLPIGMSGLAILLMLVQNASGSFAAGGMATGCYVTGLAGVAPPTWSPDRSGWPAVDARPLRAAFPLVNGGARDGGERERGNGFHPCMRNRRRRDVSTGDGMHARVPASAHQR